MDGIYVQTTMVALTFLFLFTTTMMCSIFEHNFLYHLKIKVIKGLHSSNFFSWPYEKCQFLFVFLFLFLLWALIIDPSIDPSILGGRVS